MTITKKNKQVLIFSAFLSIVTGGFIVSNTAKTAFEIFETKSSSKTIEASIDLESETEYKFWFWAIDENTGYDPADMSAEVKITIEDETVFERKISTSEFEEKGGIKRAQNGFEFKYTNGEKKTIANISGKFIKGDSWEIKAYKNMSDTVNIAPGLWIIILLIGVFIFLRIRNKKE